MQPSRADRGRAEAEPGGFKYLAKRRDVDEICKWSSRLVANRGIYMYQPILKSEPRSSVSRHRGLHQRHQNSSLHGRRLLSARGSRRAAAGQRGLGLGMAAKRRWGPCWQSHHCKIGCELLGNELCMRVSSSDWPMGFLSHMSLPCAMLLPLFLAVLGQRPWPLQLKVVTARHAELGVVHWRDR